MTISLCLLDSIGFTVLQKEVKEILAILQFTNMKFADKVPKYKFFNLFM